MRKVYAEQLRNNQYSTIVRETGITQDQLDLIYRMVKDADEVDFSKVAGSAEWAYEDVVNYLTSKGLDLSVVTLYVRFVDPKVQNVFVENTGDSRGITKDDFTNLTTLSTWFSNSDIERFPEFSDTKVTTVTDGTFKECTKLCEIDLSKVKVLKRGAFYGCSSLTGDLKLPSLTAFEMDGYSGHSEYGIFEGTGIEKVSDFGEVTQFANGVNIDRRVYSGPVKGGSGIFQNCTKLTEVSIPGVITRIGVSMFNGCTSLATINLGGITDFGNYCFQDCKVLPGFTLNVNTTTLGSSVFRGCTEFNAEINLPNLTTMTSITGLGGYQFYATKIPKIVSLGSVTTIPAMAFASCKALTEVTLSENVTKLESGVFQDSDAVTIWNLPDTISYIGAYAFRRSSIKSIDLSEITTLYGDTFYNSTLEGDVNMPKLTTITNYSEFYSGWQYGPGDFAYTNITSVSSLGSITSIPDATVTPNIAGLFYQCKSLVSVVLPETLTKLGSRTFQNCSALTTINLPTAITSFGGYVFSGCTSLEIADLNLPNLTSLNACAFVTFTGLKKISNLGKITTLPYTPYTLYWYDNWGPFACCKGLEEVTLPDTLTSVGIRSFYYCSALKKVKFGVSPLKIGEWAFSGCPALGDIQGMESVTYIGSAAFWTSGLSGTLSLPNLTTLTGAAFAKCINLKRILDLGTITTTSTTPGTLYWYESWGPFAGCEGLEEIVIPKTLKNFTDRCFYNCKSLVKFIDKAYTPQTIATAVFTNVPFTDGIYVPAGFAEDYKTATGWTSYADKIKESPYEDENSVMAVYNVEDVSSPTTILNSTSGVSEMKVFNTTDKDFITEDVVTTKDWSEEGVGYKKVKFNCGNSIKKNFNSNSLITSVFLPKNVNSLGEYAFYQCTNLKTINLENITSIHSYYVFTGAPLEGELNMPNYNTSLGIATFNGSRFTKITNLGNCTGFGGYCFANNPNLEFICIPATCTTLGNYMFQGCTTPLTIVCKASTPPNINSGFTYGPTITVIYVPDASVDAYKEAYGWSTYADKIKPISEWEGYVAD